MTIGEFNALYPHLAISDNPNFTYTSVYVSEVNTVIGSMLVSLTFTTPSGNTGMEYSYQSITSAGFASGWFAFKIPNHAWMVYDKLKAL